MAEQFGDKTQEATPHRRQQAREEGQVARSQDLVSAALLIAGLLVLKFLGSRIGTYFLGLTTSSLGEIPELNGGSQEAVFVWNKTVSGAASVVLPVLGTLVLIAIMFNLGQVGFLFLPKKLNLDVSRVSPLKGLKRIFSLTNFTRLGFGLFKIGIISGVALWSLWDKSARIMELGSQDLPVIVGYVLDIVLSTCLKIGIALFILALLDYGFQRWKHEQDLRMTTQEVREEVKTTQGDPQLAARRRAIQRQLVLNRMSTTVPQADVVVTNPTELAIAIKYDMQTMAAPIVVAKGAGVLAQRIRRLALEHGVPIVERKELARALYKQVDVHQEIPPQQYAAVAEVLRYVYELQGRSVA